MGWVEEITADSPRAWYRLGENSGFPQDSSGNGLHATTGSGAIQNVVGGLSEDGDRANFFDGVDDVWHVPSNTLLNLGDVWAIEWWMKPDYIPTVNRGVASKGTLGYEADYQSSGKIAIASGNTAVIAESISILYPGRWWHCFVSKNGATSRILVNGSVATGPVTNSTTSNTTSTFRIGTNSTTSLFFPGTLDEVILYATIPSDARILAHYLAGRPPELSHRRQRKLNRR